MAKEVRRNKVEDGRMNSNKRRSPLFRRVTREITLETARGGFAERHNTFYHTGINCKISNTILIKTGMIFILKSKLTNLHNEQQDHNG